MVKIDGSQPVKEVKPQQTELTAGTAGTTDESKKNVPMAGVPQEAPGDNVSLNKTKQKIATKAETLDYSNFGGKKEAATASTLARNVLDAVNDQLKAFQREFPGITVDLEEFPDPAKFSKKTFGKDGAYSQWQQAVSEWRNNATEAINEAQKTSITDVVKAEGEETRTELSKQQEQIVNQMVELEQITLEEFNALYAQNNHNFNKTISVIRAEGAHTRNTERAEGAKTRKTVIADGNNTRNLVYEAGKTIYNEVRIQGEYTRFNDDVNTDGVHAHLDNTNKHIDAAKEHNAKVSELSAGLSASLTAQHMPGTISKVTNLQDTIVKSKLPDDKKVELLTDLKRFASQVYISDNELKTESEKIEKAIQGQ